MRKFLYSLLLLSPMAIADMFSNPMQFYEKLQQLRAENKLPGMSSNGVTIPQPLLLDKLRTAAHQLALVVRGRVRHRLDDLRRQVTRKLGPVPAARS